MKNSFTIYAFIFSIQCCLSQNDVSFWATGNTNDKNNLLPNARFRDNIQKNTTEVWNNINNAWDFGGYSQQYQAANCLDLIAIIGFTPNLMPLSSDTILYQNNKVKERQNYTYSPPGSNKTLSFKHIYIYTSGRSEPDTLYRYFINYDTTYDVYMYDNRNRLISQSYKSRNRGASVFIERFRTEFAWDNNDNLIKTSNYQPDSAQVLQLTNEEVKTYTNNKIIEVLSWVKATGSSSDSTRTTYNYFAGTTKVSDMTTRRFSAVNGWQTVSKLTNVSQNTKGYPTQIDFAPFNTLTGVLQVTNRTLYTYYTNDTLVRSQVIQTPESTSSASMVNALKRSYEYCGVAVGTNDLTREKLDFSLFPNPTSQELSVKVDSDNNQGFNIDIINAIGQLLRKEKTPTFSIADLPSGLYFLKIEMGNKHGIQRFSKL